MVNMANQVFDLRTSRLLGIARLVTPSDWFTKEHQHDEWEFVYFTRGCGRIDIPQAVLRPQQFHLAVFPPGLLHAEVTDPLDPEETIHFSASIHGNLPADARVLLPDPRGEMGWLCERMLDEFQTNRLTEILQEYFHVFLCLVARGWERQVSQPSSIVDLAIKYMQTNYAKNISLDMIADAAHSSKSHLVHRFQSVMGVSAMMYLRYLRIEAAKCLLVTTDLHVNEIAIHVGFDDPLYCSRVFRRATGYAPTDYRRHAHEKHLDEDPLASLPKTVESIDVA